MTGLPDETIRHLRRALAWPEVGGERYLPIEPIGQGGMGVVYRAMDRVLGREVALKVLRPELADEALEERLRREARILARLEHPGIVPVHDAGVLADGRVYYVMKLVHGVRLDEFTRTATRGEALRLFLRLLDTIAFAHAQGIVHRDLKPSNIMVGSYGEVLVLDWGIARVLGAPDVADSVPAGDSVAAGAEPATRPGLVLGTPGFMAPEQARGENAGLDHRADIYALGRLLAEVATRGGRSRPLESIVGRATAPSPGDRYATAADLARDIVRLLDGGPVSAHREGSLERLGRLYQRYQTPILLVLAYLTMRLLFLVFRRL